MRIVLDPGEPLEGVRDGGSVWYVRDGVLVGRGVVKPRNNRTPYQTAERSFMVSGQRLWNGALSQAARDTWIAGAP